MVSNKDNEYIKKEQKKLTKFTNGQKLIIKKIQSHRLVMG